VLADVNRHSPQQCLKCKTWVEVDERTWKPRIADDGQRIHEENARRKHGQLRELVIGRCGIDVGPYRASP